MVPSNTDLISLISYAGGPSKGAKLSDVKIVHAGGSIDQEKEYISKINIQKYIQSGDEKIIPKLTPDDTIVISGSKWYHVNNAIEFVTKISTIVQVYSWIFYYLQK